VINTIVHEVGKTTEKHPLHALENLCGCHLSMQQATSPEERGLSMSAQSIPHHVGSGNPPDKTGYSMLDASSIEQPSLPPASDGRGHHHGHRPTAIGMPDHQDMGKNRTHVANDASRATYLLEYGHDVVARLHLVAPHVACHLAAILTGLKTTLPAILLCGDPTLLADLVDHLDAALAPGEWFLQEVGA
jgi:hypothetical protein